jgi:hypothetical protein
MQSSVVTHFPPCGLGMQYPPTQAPQHWAGAVHAESSGRQEAGGRFGKSEPPSLHADTDRATPPARTQDARMCRMVNPPEGTIHDG